MKSKKIYLVRHGQTDYNKKGIVQGSGIDAPLNELGIQQANCFFKNYKHIKFDKVYTSNLQRSVQSVQSFIDLNIAHEKLEELNEISWGKKEGVPVSLEENDHYLKVTEAWQNGEIDMAIDGGESPRDVQKRQERALSKILSNKNESEILICMHGRAIRIFLCLMLNYHLKYMDVFPHQNLGLYKIFYNGDNFSVKWFNDARHLM